MTHALSEKRLPFLTAAAMLFHPADYTRSASHIEQTMNGAMSKVMAKRVLELTLRSKDALAPFYREKFNEDIEEKINKILQANNYSMESVYNEVLAPLVGHDLDEYMRRATT